MLDGSALIGVEGTILDLTNYKGYVYILVLREVNCRLNEMLKCPVKVNEDKISNHYQSCQNYRDGSGSAVCSCRSHVMNIFIQDGLNDPV